MKGKLDLETKFDNVLRENLFISEMTLAELKFGVENREHWGQLFSASKYCFSVKTDQ